MVVIVDVIVHASLELFKAGKRCKMEVLGPEGAEEALDHRVVKAVALAAHALRDSAPCKHRPIGPHFVVPTLIRMHGQFAGMWTCPVSTDGLKVLDLLCIFNQIDLTVAVN